MTEDRDAHAKVLAAPFDRDKAERARNKFIEIQVLIDALDRAISGEARHRANRLSGGGSEAPSINTVAAEYCLDFFVAREVSPHGAFFDNSPLFVGKVIPFARVLDLAGETRNFLLVRRRPGQNAIENFLNLLFRHDEIIANSSSPCHD